MNIVVFKYTINPEEIDLTGAVTLNLPISARVLCVHEQRGAMCLWASHEVPSDSTAPWIQKEMQAMEPRRFFVLPTGEIRDIGVEARYIGSVFLHNVSLVFHVFESL